MKSNKNNFTVATLRVSFFARIFLESAWLEYPVFLRQAARLAIEEVETNRFPRDAREPKFRGSDDRYQTHSAIGV